MSGIICAIVGSFSTAAAAQVIRYKKTFGAFGNAQVDTAQSKFGGGSALFDGTGDYITTGNSPDLAFGTGDFTIECWFRVSSTGAYRTIYCGGTQTVAGNIAIYLNNSELEVHQYGGGYNEVPGSIFKSGALTINTNTWYHFALTRSSSTSRLFLDGVLKNTVTGDTHNWYQASNPIIGHDMFSSSTWIGWIEEFRISKIARYTSGFTPSTTPFTNDDNTLLLLHMDGTDGSTYFEDDNGIRTPKGIQALGNAQIDNTQSKFGGTSYLGDGTGDYLQIPHNTDFEFGSGNFTVEFWARTNSFGSQTYTPIVGQWQAGLSESNLGWYVSVNSFNNQRKMSFNYSNGSSTTIVTFGSDTSATGVWNHYAIVRSGNTIYGFKDGTLLNTGGTSFTATINAGTSPMFIGALGASSESYNGWIDELRISNTARYTSSFTAPTAPFVNDSNTLLLLHMDGTDASTVFRDDNGVRESKGVQALGNAQIDNAQSKFGGTSAYFDGTDDLIRTYQAETFAGDFTFECWFRPTNTTTAYRTIIALGEWTATGQPYNLGQYGSDLFVAYYGGGNDISASAVLSANTWYHAAVVRSGSTVTLYLNGTSVGTKTNRTQTLGNTLGYTIGNLSNLADDFNGHIDEVRISNIARYTVNFTPSAIPFSNDANTLLLLHMDGTDASTVFVDDNGVIPKTV